MIGSFIAQYGMVVLAVLAVAERDVWPMLLNGNIERVIREEERDLDAFEAKILLARMAQEPQPEPTPEPC